MAQSMSQFTDQWMTNPYMFDPTQLSNQFSNFNNAALPFPPTYNTGAGGPVNAATGQPIQSFQQWQQANPGGTTLNSTPAQPQAAPPPTPQGITQYNSTGQFGQQAVPYQAPGGQPANFGFSAGGLTSGIGANGPSAAYQQAMGQQGAGSPQQQSGGGAPNNWQAAINALANPGRVQTMGANVPQVTGYQPSGGVNQAFLQQAGAGQGMNQNYLSALRAIQGRPQG